MNTITAIVTPEADGTLRVSLPPDMRGKPLRITASTMPEEDGNASQPNPKRELPVRSSEEIAQRATKLHNALEQLRARGTFAEITDPVAWQLEIRKDPPMFREDP